LQKHFQLTVQITLSSLGNPASTLVLVVLENTDLLESLHGLAVDGAGAVDVMARTGTAVLSASVDLAETADTDGLAHVNMAGDGGGTDVEPVKMSVLDSWIDYEEVQKILCHSSSSSSSSSSFFFYF